MTTSNAGDIVTGYKYGWHDPEFKPVNIVRKGLDREIEEQGYEGITGESESESATTSAGRV